jgi:hypothetical protein
VLVNYGNRPVDAGVTWGAASRRVEICQPQREDRIATLPTEVRLAPQGCAVVVELPA